MTRSRAVAFFSVLILGAASVAQASAISFSDVFDPADVLFSRFTATCTGINGDTDSASASACRSLTWTHVLPGFNPLTDILTEGMLTLSLYDDGDPAAEKFDIVMDLLSANNHAVTSTPFFNVLTQLIDGSLHVALSDQNGDFHFTQSRLTAEGTRSDVTDVTPSVPEPAMLALFSASLFGLGARFRRRSHSASARTTLQS